MACISRCSDDEFIALWNEHHSANTIAQILNLNLRGIHARRRRLELKHKIQLGAAVQSPIKKVVKTLRFRAIENIDDGVFVVASDAHFVKGVTSTAQRALLAVIDGLRPHTLVHNGDLLDGASIGKYPRIMWQRVAQVQDELDAIHEHIDCIKTLSPKTKRRWIWGNHCMRFNTRLSAVAPQFENVAGFNLEDHFPDWAFSMSLMVNNSVMIKHRYHLGTHATYNNVLKAGTSIITGHLHALQVRPYTDYNGTRYAVDTGTLSAVNANTFEYGEDNPVNHRSGFAVLTFYKGKLMPPELLEVLDEEKGIVFFRGHRVEV